MEHLGLVGLADSGHARLFSALTGLDAATSSEKVLGVVQLPDHRLDKLAAMSESKNVVPATFEIMYIPGLSTEPGKGLGSRLLGQLRDCDAVLFVLRATDGNDPASDLDDPGVRARPRRPRVGRAAARQAATPLQGGQDPRSRDQGARARDRGAR